jgi:predicted amidohydrolase YtcJ
MHAPSHVVACVAVLLPLGAAVGQSRSHHVRTTSAPDVVLVNGRVFTGDTTHRWAEALAIRGDRIVAVGTTGAITALAVRSTSRIDLGGRLVIPGINDAHIHLGGNRDYAVLKVGTTRTIDPPFAMVQDSLRSVVARTPGTGWIIGDVGAIVLGDSTARRDALDAISTQHPVMLTGYTGHGYILNSAALRALGVRDDAVDPLGGHLERDARTGRVTGLLEEYAGWNAARHFAEAPSDSALVAYMRRDGREMVQYGITSVQDMALAYGAARTLRVMRAVALPIRVRVIGMAATTVNGRLLSGWDSVRRSRDTLHGPTGGTIAVSGIKWILDGTPVERLALLRRDYTDWPGWRGRADFPPDTIRAMMLEARARRQQLMLHTAGDSTAAVVLDEMERTGGATAWRNERLRLEHGDGLAADLRARARALGIVVVQNPAHFTFPAVLRERYGSVRARSVQPLRTLLAEHIPVAFGSDGQLNPFLNILFATTHPNNPGEAITVEQAVLAYTRGSAYAEFAEHEKGMLAPGMLADLAVLSQDIFTIAPRQLPATRSILTMVGGRIVYQDPHFAAH